ncbi:MAG: hypothetical protein ACO3LE_10335 [Bdellovibrionota bacterium]
MNNKLYNKPVRRKKEEIYYVARIGDSRISLIIISEEPTYYRVKSRLDQLANQGEFEPVFPRGRVHIRRVARFPKDLSNKGAVVNQIKRRFNAISWQDLQEAKQTKEIDNLERFFTSDLNTDDFNPVISMKQTSFREYALDVLTQEFPELVKNLSREYKMLAEDFEIV